jgi:hypothetical protein
MESMKNELEMMAKQLHKELWSWLAENPQCGKVHWPRWADNGGDVPVVRNRCFPCEIAKPGNFKQCPIEWPGGWCLAEHSPVLRFLNARTPKERASAAREVAALPWRFPTEEPQSLWRREINHE